MNLLTEHSDHLQEFVSDVQRRAGLERYEEAHQLALATVEVLGQSLSGGGRGQQLAGWLPRELGEQLGSQSGHASAFDRANFLEKVGGKIYTVDAERVRDQVSAALRALRTTGPAEEFDDTMNQLPQELADMFSD